MPLNGLADYGGAVPTERGQDQIDKGLDLPDGLPAVIGHIQAYQGRRYGSEPLLVVVHLGASLLR